MRSRIATMTMPKRKPSPLSPDRPISHTKRCRRSETKDDIMNAQYLIADGLRKVSPYYFDYKTHAKGRWVGRSVLDIFQTEFADRPSSYYKAAIEQGNVTVNDAKVDCGHVIKNNDRISHSIHRHEPPITCSDIQILAVSDEYLIVNKPASIPVHPTGRYRHNTVTHLLAHHWDQWVLKHACSPSQQLLVSRVPLPLHRIDRLTSGILLFCLQPDRVSQLAAQFTSNVIGKQYLCRVIGEFPDHHEIQVDEPIKVLHHKLGLNHIHPEGKPSTTYFKRLAYNGTESLVLARPITGRTHQIRLHLRHLGHPITNDPLYNNPLHKHVIKDQQSWQNAVDVATCSPSTLESGQNSESNIKKPEVDGESSIEWIEAVANAQRVMDLRVVGQCPECDTDLLADPDPIEMLIYLHAFQYTLCGDLGLPESQYAWYDPASQRTTIQSSLPTWATGWPGLTDDQLTAQSLSFISFPETKQWIFNL